MSGIGSTHVSAGAFLESFGLARFQAMLPSQEFRRIAAQTGCAPKRRSRLTPEVVAWLMMVVALNTESMTQGLIRAWKWVCHLCPLPHRGCVTEEAFCQARAKLTLTFWRTLWRRLSARYQTAFASHLRWKGRLRVLAIDGSDVNLPTCPELARFFTCPKNDKGRSRQPQGRLVALCSVATGFCLAFKFVSLRFTEHHALQHLIRKLRKNDLVLLDRGFFSLSRPLAHSPAESAFPHADLESGSGIRPPMSAIGASGLESPVSPFSLLSSQMSRPAR